MCSFVFVTTKSNVSYSVPILHLGTEVSEKLNIMPEPYSQKGAEMGLEWVSRNLQHRHFPLCPTDPHSHVLTGHPTGS